jgi:serine/threonine-protein kinase
VSTLPKFAHYDVLGRLATGGMADVWLARVIGMAGFEKLVVIKTILPQLAENPTFVSMFVNEGRLAAMLSHPNCVQVFELGEEGGLLFLVMEYIEGFSLSRVLQRAKELDRPPSERVLARIMMDAASGLDYAHRLSDREGRPLHLVHRDVSPDNLLISFAGQTRVVDFGIARAITPAVLSAATVAGTIKGKHGFIAPEYLLGLPIDGRADVFAMGVVLYRALTRKRPFAGANDAAVSMAVLNDTPPAPHEVVPTVSPALSAVVMMALQKDPSARFDSARAMRQALEVAVGRAAEPEDVAEYLETLWPAGDAERVKLHSLASGHSAEEHSGPALQSVVSGAWGEAHPVAPAPAGVHATPPTTEELTRQLSRPAVTHPAPPPPTVSFEALPSFDPPPGAGRIARVIAVLAVLLLGAGGYAMFRREQAEVAPPSAPAPELTTGTIRIAPPVVVKVLEGKEELGTSPLELTRAPGAYVFRLINRGAGVDQSISVSVAVGEVATVDSLARGALVVKAEPWASVKVNGRSMGMTPVTAKGLYEGVHVVEAENANLHLTRRLEVKVKSGETKVVSIDFED